MIAGEIEDDVVLFGAGGAIFFGVVDHAIGAERADQDHISCAAYAGHFCAEPFRDLDGERADTSGRGVDQDFLPWLDVGLVAKCLQGGEGCDADAGCLLEGYVIRFQSHRLIRGAYVLGEGAAARPENRIAGFELSYVFANGFDYACDIDTKTGDLWFARSQH